MFEDNYSSRFIFKMYREILREENKFGSLEDFYHISDKRLKIKIHRLKQNDRSIMFSIIFTRVPEINLLKSKISKYVLIDVARYAEEKINISLGVKYPYDYPFNPPEWFLCKCNDNILNEDISIYYKFIIQAHNEIYSTRGQWSPAIPLRADFLDLFTKIFMGIQYTLNEKTL
tara:strand:- start:241 stop:759 length:519 start_codon:yes stop_codon:yes gene_type:complete